jgi:hypothetical protein
MSSVKPLEGHIFFRMVIQYTKQGSVPFLVTFSTRGFLSGGEKTPFAGKIKNSTVVVAGYIIVDFICGKF